MAQALVQEEAEAEAEVMMVHHGQGPGVSLGFRCLGVRTSTNLSVIRTCY
jgi:hypothetical protein